MCNFSNTSTFSNTSCSSNTTSSSNTNNTINPQKLMNSKWTAVLPQNKEKHFVVTKVSYDEEGNVTLCLIEAVFTRRVAPIDWHTLKDSDNWLMGWQ